MLWFREATATGPHGAKPGLVSVPVEPALCLERLAPGPFLQQHGPHSWTQGLEVLAGFDAKTELALYPISSTIQVS